jgi:hypothetical protein
LKLVFPRCGGVGSGQYLLTLWTLFSDIHNVYESLYWSLSIDAHNNISALRDRHFGEKDGRRQIMVFKDNRPGQLAMYYDALLTIVIDCAGRLHTFLKSPRARYYDYSG